jgi:hypothetical protein
MRIITGTLLLILAMPILAGSLGETATLSFGVPQTRENGDVLEYIEIKEFEAVCGNKTTVVTKEQAQDGVHVVPTAELLPGYGEYECVMTVTDTNGLRSKPSEAVIVSWEAVVSPIPQAPTDLGTGW